MRNQFFSFIQCDVIKYIPFCNNIGYVELTYCRNECTIVNRTIDLLNCYLYLLLIISIASKQKSIQIS